MSACDLLLFTRLFFILKNIMILRIIITIILIFLCRII